MDCCRVPASVGCCGVPAWTAEASNTAMSQKVLTALVYQDEWTLVVQVNAEKVQQVQRAVMCLLVPHQT